MPLTTNLFLTGFMAAGKSSVGRSLAQRLGCSFADLDTLIEAKAGKTIMDIFAEQGEAAFRQLETEVLLSLPTEAAGVYATGGGTIMAAENRRFMQRVGRIVYLRASWQTLQRRLADSSGRPLAASDNDWASVRQRLEQRLPIYEQADLIVDTDGHSVDQVVGRIIETVPR